MHFWTDQDGTHWPVPSHKTALQFRLPGHARIRAFVYRRDAFACGRCGAAPVPLPSAYDGARNVTVTPPNFRPQFLTVAAAVIGEDYGALKHHPDALRTMCAVCNRIAVAQYAYARRKSFGGDVE